MFPSVKGGAGGACREVAPSNRRPKGRQVSTESIGDTDLNEPCGGELSRFLAANGWDEEMDSQRLVKDAKAQTPKLDGSFTRPKGGTGGSFTNRNAQKTPRNTPSDVVNAARKEQAETAQRAHYSPNTPRGPAATGSPPSQRRDDGVQPSALSPNAPRPPAGPSPLNSSPRSGERMNRFNRSGAPGGPSGAASSSTGAGEGDTLTMSDAIAGHAARNKQRDGKAAAPGGFLAKASGAVGGAVSRIWGAATTAASGGATPRTAATTGGVANLRESSYTEGSGGRPPGGAQSCCNSSFKQRASAAGAESSGQPRSAREERTGKDSPKDSGSVIRRVHQPAPSEVTGAEGYRRASRVGGGSRVGDEAGRNMPGRRVNGGSFTARDGPARQYGGSFTNRGVVQGGGRRSSIDYETIDHDAWEAAMKEMRRANGDDEDEEDDGNRRSVIEGRARLPSEKASGTDSNSRMSSIESRYSSIENSRYSSVELGGDEFKGEAKRRASVAQLFANLEAAEAAKFTDAVDRAAEGTAEQAAARAEHSPDPSSGMGDRASRAADRSERSERTSYLGRRSEANRTSQFDRTGRLDVSAEDPAESSPALARRTPSNAPTSNSAYTTAAAAGQDDPDKKRSVGPVASSLQNQLDKFDAMQDNDGNTPRSAREVGAGGRRRSSVTTAFRAAAAATSLQQGFQREDGAQQRRGSLANVPLGRRASMVIDPTAPTDAHGLPISAHAHQKKKDVLKLHAAFAENTTNAAKAPSADRTKGPKPDTFKAVLKLYYPHASRPDLDEMESWVSEETESAKPRANSSERGPTDFTLEQRSEIRQLFACYSTHPQKESVTLRDLRIGWKETGLDFTEVDAIFRRIDSDRSGTLDIDEFTKLAAELNLYDQHDAADLLGSARQRTRKQSLDGRAILGFRRKQSVQGARPSLADLNEFRAADQMSRPDRLSGPDPDRPSLASVRP